MAVRLARHQTLGLASTDAKLRPVRGELGAVCGIGFVGGGVLAAIAAGPAEAEEALR